MKRRFIIRREVLTFTPYGFINVFTLRLTIKLEPFNSTYDNTMETLIVIRLTLL